MTSTKRRSFSMNLRDVENFFKYRRMPYPKRSAEFIALIAVSCTLFLFLHTKTLNSRLHEMEIKLQPSELSAIGLSASNSIQSGSDSKSDLKGVHGTYQYLKSTGQVPQVRHYVANQTPMRHYKADDNQKQHFTAGELNNTKRAEMNLIFFNRVPKVGSQKLMALMRSLGQVHDFTVGRDPANSVETIILNKDEQNDLAEEVADIEEPAAYSKHVAFVNFTKFDLPRPIYVNMVRDPVERIISWFYYVRAPWYFVERKMLNDKLPLPKPAWLRKDFETCIKNGDKECSFVQNAVKEGVGDHRRQTLFFCGHEKAVCLPFNSAKAMQIAKRTVEKEYAVVGSWEETNITLAVLEKYIPLFFDKATLVYYQSAESLSKINKNIFKPPVSEEVKDIVRKNLTHEIEFYQFCMQRLYRQYEAIKLN